MDINMKYMVDKSKIRNVLSRDGNRLGFEFKLKIPYYRGVALSMVDDLFVTVGEDHFPKERLTFTVDGHTYTWPQIETVTTFRWEYGQEATVFVPLEFGIFSVRPTKVEIGCAIRMSYMGRKARPCIVSHIVDPDEMDTVCYEGGEV